MKIALCYESVIPARGGCETYIADLARRFVADRHEVHLYACTWDEHCLPNALHYHRLSRPRGPRFLRPWLFGFSCLRALRGASDLVSVGFNKTWGLDVLYPQAGLHVATAEHNLLKYPNRLSYWAAKVAKAFDLAHWSYLLLERRQYLSRLRPVIVVNSEMVRRDFRQFYGVPAELVHVIHSAIDPDRFTEDDRPKRRLEWRQFWGIAPDEAVGLFIAMNYQLKGLDPLLHAVAHLPSNRPFRLLVVGNPDYRKYEKLAGRLGITETVRFAGFYPDTRNCYFAADFLIHPTFYDPCSLVALEALACGLPVITSRFNGAHELLSPPLDDLLILNPHDHKTLADAITRLLDTAQRLPYTQAARRQALHWTFEHHYRHLLGVLGEAAARNRAA